MSRRRSISGKRSTFADMPGLVIALLLSQAAEPGALVLVTRRVAIAPKLAETVAQQVRGALAAAGVPAPFSDDEAARRLLALGVKDAARCDANTACIVEFGLQLLVQNVVSLDVA